jgi:hypothetical protein
MGRVAGGGSVMARDLTDDERASFRAEIDRLREEHRDLDVAIEALLHLGRVDQLQVQRFKKRKLVLRDRLSFLEDQMTPDIIA